MSRFKAVRLMLPLLLVALLLMETMPTASAAPPPGKGRSSVYIVQMVQDPVVAYEGGISGLQPTKPGKGEKINPNSARVQRYVQFLEGQHNAALTAVGANAKIYSYRYSFNGFAAKLTPEQVAALQARPDVVRVWADELRQLQTDNTPGFLGLTDAESGLWLAYKGEDVIIGVIDTGIWPEHPSFSDQEDLAYRPGNTGKRTRVYGAPPADWYGRCDSGRLFSQDACNHKLIGARYFYDGFTNFEINVSGDYLSPRDADGHGTHTASTAGGNEGVPATIYGLDKGVVSGMAPRARIAAYKGCWANAGCAISDLTEAIDTAVADGVDVINYSIGSDVPDYTGPDDVAFLFAANAGIFVATSAGNSGPDPSTVGSPAASPWLTAVGANSHSRLFLSDITVVDKNFEPVDVGQVWGGSVTPGVTSYRLVDAEAVNGGANKMCLEPFAPGTFAPNDVVLCNEYDFGVARVARVANVKAGGGGAVLFHNVASVNAMPTDNHVLPTVHMLYEVGLPLKELADDPDNPYLVTFTSGSAVYSPDPRVKAPVMASFSSRGPNGGALDIIKPDITAPGLSILAGNTPTPFLGEPGQLFQAIQGTSMSSPHIAGIGALLVEAHPTWSPAQIKSAIMTTANPNVPIDDDTLATPFDMGAGQVTPNSAVDPGLVYDADLWDYVAFMCGTVPYWTQATCDLALSRGGSLEPSDLNLASIGIADLAGIQTVKRTVTNVGPAGDYAVEIAAPAGVSVEVSPNSLTLGEGESATYEVTFTTQDGAALDTWAFGSLTWSDGSHSVRSALAVRPVALAAPAEVNGSGTDGSLAFDVIFGYSGDYSAAAYGLVAADQQPGNVVDDPSNDINTALGTGVGITEHTVSVPAGTTYLRISLFDDYTDGNDDLDLYIFDEDDNFVGGSGSATSAEEVNISAPFSDTYTVIVHGWQTDGPDANYTLFAWSVPAADSGNMTLTAPAAATLGATEEITVNWSGLDAGTKYLGAVAHVGPSDELLALTLVHIATDTTATAGSTSGVENEGENRIFLPALQQ